MKGRRAAMRTKLERCSALVTFVLLAAGSDSLLAGEPKALPRSLYVPLAFRTCEHLTGATLFIGDQPVGPLPQERIFVFTYYPNLKRVEPAFTEIRIEGAHSSDGSPFIGRLAVDPGAITSADERIDLGFEDVKQQLDYRIDVRYDKVSVIVRCEPTCGLDHDHEGAATAQLETAPPTEVAEQP
jgi:hypothetical protein